jgi:hypothetical protein
MRGKYFRILFVNKEAQTVKSNPAESNEPVPFDSDHEVRFAVVMYGGVSLAIYINGVAQELLNMVRATAPNTADDDKADKAINLVRAVLAAVLVALVAFGAVHVVDEYFTDLSSPRQFALAAVVALILWIVVRWVEWRKWIGQCWSRLRRKPAAKSASDNSIAPPAGQETHAPSRPTDRQLKTTNSSGERRVHTSSPT